MRRPRLAVLVVLSIGAVSVLTASVWYLTGELSSALDETLVRHYAPLTYAGSAPENGVVAKIHRSNGFVCIQYWFCWAGEPGKIGDNEPFFVYVRGEDVYALAYRVHYVVAQKYNDILMEGTHPVATFFGPFHVASNAYPKGFEQPFDYTPRVDRPPEDIDGFEWIRSVASLYF